MDKKLMPNLTLENIAKVCDGTFVGPRESLQKVTSGIVIDSRLVEPGDLFIPIKGARVDGHQFIPEVFEKGAICVLSEHALANPKGPYILVDDAQVAMKRVAAFYRRELHIKVVGITGSVGKTSTKEMISSVLAERFDVLKTAGNFNNEIGLPLTIFKIRDNHNVAVLEMGISDFGEMHRLSAMAYPDICVITNIGLCHLENLGNRDGILAAKTECFEHMKDDGTVVLNGDDDKLCTQTKVNGKEVVFYGIEPNGLSNKAIYATDVESLGFEGMKATIHTPAGEFSVVIPIPGGHNVYNALAATGVALELGLSLEEIKRGIENVESIAGRTNFVKINTLTVIDDCYNANPVSMKAAIDVLSYAKGRSIAVLGDMGELGATERELHYGVGTYLGEKKIDTLFCAGELAKAYASGAADANSNCEIHYFEKREDMINELLSYVDGDDSILIKASHFMAFEQVLEALKGLAQ